MHPILSGALSPARRCRQRRRAAGSRGTAHPGSPPGMKGVPGLPHGCAACRVPVSALPWDAHTPRSAGHPRSSARGCRTRTASPGEIQKFPEAWVTPWGKQSVLSCLLVRGKAEKGKQVLLLETATFEPRDQDTSAHQRPSARDSACTGGVRATDRVIAK